MIDFRPIMTAYGFAVVDAEMLSTIAGFSHDLSNALLTNGVFDPRSKITHHPDHLNNLIRCDLICASGTLSNSLDYFFDRWMSDLRYENPVREIIDTRTTPKAITIQILLVGRKTAITLLFRLHASSNM